MAQGLVNRLVEYVIIENAEIGQEFLTYGRGDAANQ